ncbi:MAG TPA: ATP-binding protein [Puia sp.]|nr:ATP-binding protein [Puia sp.]
MKVTIERKLITGIAIAITGVLAIVLISIRQSGRLQDTAANIRHTHQVIYETQEVLGISDHYELSVKNFLLTGDSVFLDSLAGYTSLLRQKIAGLKELTRDNAAQQERIDILQNYVDKNRKLLDEAIRMSQRKDFQGVAALIANGASIGYSRQIQSLIGRIEEEENQLLDQRRKTNRGAASGLQAVLWTLIVAVAILAIVVFRKVWIDLAKEKLAKEQLNRFNRELEEQVRLQTSELKESEDKYKSLFYKSPLPKWIYDLETLQFLEVNEKAILNYGYSQKEFLQMKISDIRPAEDEPRLLNDVEEARSSSEESRYGVWRHIKKNGEIIFVEVTAHPIEYDHRRARMVVVNDITGQRRSALLLQELNEALKKRAAELALSNAELERFAYIASHDLQEPLRMVSSFLQLLQKRYHGQLDEKAGQYIHYAVDGAERMKALIQDLLEYSRVGTGKESWAPVDTAEVVEEVGNTFREKIIAARARVEIGPLPVVRGDKVQLVQLFQNLVGNALKYHSEDPPVLRIRATEEPGYWLFAMEDNGIGIDPLFFDKIFIIFQRLHNKSDYSGTGIGLAICKKIVERHGGRIWVESAPGKGSTFYFTITKHL